MIEWSRKAIKPNVIIESKMRETTKDTILRFSRTLEIKKIQIVQSKAFQSQRLILQMSSNEDQTKLIQHKKYFIDNKREISNPLMIIYYILTKMKDEELLEELVESNLHYISEE